MVHLRIRKHLLVQHSHHQRMKDLTSFYQAIPSHRHRKMDQRRNHMMELQQQELELVQLRNRIRRHHRVMKDDR